MPNSCNFGSLDNSTILCLTAAKSEPFIFPVLGFVFACVSKIYIFMILYDFCLLLASFCYIVVNVRNFECQMKSAGRCVPLQVTSGAEGSILQALQFQQVAVRHKLPGWTGISHFGRNQCIIEG
jgi:hypothetical protein